MRDTERIISEWVSGVPASVPGEPFTTVRTVVVETDEWIPALVSAGVIDARTAVIHRGEHAAPTAGWSRTYIGTFTAPAGDVIFADGFRLRQTRYGLADFSCLDAPTALVLLDEHDFSAFLRDADVAWSSGVFANHVTHPLAVLANVDALGAATGRSGPNHRLFVDSDGSISTAPLGSPLGRAWEDPAALTAGWNSADAKRGSDSVSLRKVLQDMDRREAIAERPWLARYFEVAHAIRLIRTEHLAPGRASGFGGRLTVSNDVVGIPAGRADACGLPVLIELGDAVCAVDPATGASRLLTPTEVAVAERALGSTPGLPTDQRPSWDSSPTSGKGS